MLLLCFLIYRIEKSSKKQLYLLHFVQLEDYFISFSSNEQDKQPQALKSVSKARIRDQFGKAKKRFFKLYKSK